MIAQAPHQKPDKRLADEIRQMCRTFGKLSTNVVAVEQRATYVRVRFTQWPSNRSNQMHWYQLPAGMYSVKLPLRRSRMH